MDAQTLQRQADLFRALMHPVRLAILEILRDGEECVCHLETRLGHRQAYISQQLAVLREAGLVKDRRDGWNAYYWVARPEVFALLDTARAMVGGAAEPRRADVRLAECPCPKCAASVEETTGARN